MKKGKTEDCYDKAEKVDIVGTSYAVVEPSAVMIELDHTSIALSTMLGRIMHIGFTSITIIFKALAVKGFSKLNEKRFAYPLALIVR